MIAINITALIIILFIAALVGIALLGYYQEGTTFGLKTILSYFGG